MNNIKLIRRCAPYVATAALKLLEDTFGIDEVLLEAPQLSGKEIAVNKDIVWEAWDGDLLVGTIHATIPLNCPHICGLSAMATHPSVRGKGLGRVLFAKILEEIDSQGVTTAFLGTSNPIAAKLYHSLGFSFLPGSHVMVRYLKGDTVDFALEHYSPICEDVAIHKDTSAIRIPLIPLTVIGSKTKVLDINTGLFHRDLVTQRSCMGLYPRYDKLLEKGGHFYAAFDKPGTLGAMLSTVPTEDGIRADFFCCEGFADVIAQLLERCGEKVYLQIAECDEEKQAFAKKLGFSPASEASMFPCGDVWLPFRIYK